MNYRRKPLTVIAEQFHGFPCEGVCQGEFCPVAPHSHFNGAILFIKEGDYVIKHNMGYYPMSEESFNHEYERV